MIALSITTYITNELQVKTLSFVTYLLRSYSDSLKQYERGIIDSVMLLLRQCPEESISTRKVGGGLKSIYNIIFS